ncbi:uncharacterized protein LOC116484231 [Hylobates moloch]|uniref:uncharacterized protein LOC116484231 n=1 Tax=Hylobates moloch TaxID=81572 RepID=UPI00267638A8|nr:uncharacterized protein LOC116484231 [Hylobates moloch]
MWTLPGEGSFSVPTRSVCETRPQGRRTLLLPALQAVLSVVFTRYGMCTLFLSLLGRGPAGTQLLEASRRTVSEQTAVPAPSQTHLDVAKGARAKVWSPGSSSWWLCHFVTVIEFLPLFGPFLPHLKAPESGAPHIPVLWVLCLAVRFGATQCHPERGALVLTTPRGSDAVSLCGLGAVEACLLHQLRRHATGFLCSDKMAALFTKVGKTCPVAGEICHKVKELQQQAEGRKPSGVSQEALRRQRSVSGKAPALSPQALKHIWVRTALIEKVLDKVVQYLAENCSKYYEKEALLADPVFGPILASLLGEPESTGACARPAVGMGQVLREHRLSWLSLSPQWDPVPWNTLSSRQPITTGLTPLLMSWSRGTASGVRLLARTPLQSAQPCGSGNGTQAAARRRTGWLPAPVSVWSPCTRIHGRGCFSSTASFFYSHPTRDTKALAL